MPGMFFVWKWLSITHLEMWVSYALLLACTLYVVLMFNNSPYMCVCQCIAVLFMTTIYKSKIQSFNNTYSVNERKQNNVVILDANAR